MIIRLRRISHDYFETITATFDTFQSSVLDFLHLSPSPLSRAKRHILSCEVVVNKKVPRSCMSPPISAFLSSKPTPYNKLFFFFFRSWYNKLSNKVCFQHSRFQLRTGKWHNWQSSNSTDGLVTGWVTLTILHWCGCDPRQLVCHGLQIDAWSGPMSSISPSNSTHLFLNFKFNIFILLFYFTLTGKMIQG